MLTTRGWWLFLFLLGMTALALAIDNPPLGAACLTVLVWFVSAWFWFAIQVRLAHGKLTVVRVLSNRHGPVETMWTGQTFSVHVELHSGSPLALPYVAIADRVPPFLQRLEGTNEADGALSRRGSVALDYQVGCPAAGKARFDGLAVYATDLQGLFLHYWFLRNVREYLVIPAVSEDGGRLAGSKRHNLLPLLGLHSHPRPGTGSELLDLRDYLPGDPPKTIAWKVSARRDRLMTKVFESEVPIRCTLFVDASSSTRVGGPGENSLARLVEIAAGVARTSARHRDLTGLCVFDDQSVRYQRPGRGPRHMANLIHLLADAAGRPPYLDAGNVQQLLPLGFALAQELYPDYLVPEVNAMPAWLPWLFPPSAWTTRFPPLRARSICSRPVIRLRRYLRLRRRAMRQFFWSRFSPAEHRAQRRRKQMAALLSARYSLGPGGLAALLEDDAALGRHLQRFLAEHQVPAPVAWYDDEGRYLFASPAKIDVLARAFLRAVGKGHDNELFVILADLLEMGDHLGQLQAAVKSASARHHQVLILCPWPDSVPEPPAQEQQQEIARDLPRTLNNLPRHSPTVQALLQRIMILRLHRAFFNLRRTFARMGVPVVCAGVDEAVALIQKRLERLRVQERGVR
jgi:uncharacterized protein (DUF58 family)